MKALVAYFSASGVTKNVAQLLAEITNADIFEIAPEVPYSSADLNWNDPKSRSSVEMQDTTFRPPIAGKVSNMAEYDTIFLGFPIWWYTAPRIISTFLESYEFSGKTIIPFATSGGSGLGKTEDDIKAICPPSVLWKPGKLLAKRLSSKELTEWVKNTR